MLIPSLHLSASMRLPSLSRRVNANSQPDEQMVSVSVKLIKKGEC